MNEVKKTLIFAGVAAGLALLAFLFSPSLVTPDRFLDQGEPFFPNFTDPNSAMTLEVVEFDQATGAPAAFKVTFENGRWVIPSHHNYPADAKDRLAQTAAGLIDIKRDDYRSDNVADFESFSVVDPLDEAAGLTGRGKRVTIKNAGGELLADLIFGTEIPDRPGFRYVRQPDEKRVYAARAQIDISTRFQDWIDRDLLQLSKPDIDRIAINDYTINERTRSVDRRGRLVLTEKDNSWSLPGMRPDVEIDSATIADMLGTLDSLLIVGVRPKPQGVSASLKQEGTQTPVSPADARSLQGKGFFFTRDGQLMSNEGEMEIQTGSGIRYTLRFGEVVVGSGPEVTAGTEGASSGRPTGGDQNRYLFVTAEFDPAALPEPAKPANTDFQKKADSLWADTDRDNKRLDDVHATWSRKVAAGRATSQALNDRFADWYYVISNDSFEKLHKAESELIVAKQN